MWEDTLTPKQADLIQKGLKDGLIRFEAEEIVYVIQNKRYKFTDPEEPVRASTYLELVYRYKYDPKRIDFEILPPRREPKLPADIVVYKSDERDKVFIVAENKASSSESEISTAKRQGLGNANLLLAEWLLLVCGKEKLVFHVKDRPSLKRLDAFRRAELPIAYGKVPKYRFKKGGDILEELRKVSLNELQSKFQRCHDAIWEGGKRDPAEAFDEMSKLMFAKIYDEKFTKLGEYYRFQIGTHENAFIVAKRVGDELYKSAQDKEPEVFKQRINVSDEIIFEVVSILQDISLTKTDLDAKGRAFEQFLGKVFRGELGQFFTPREIIEFMVEFVNPGYEDVIMDPACGSGGFLLYSIKHIIDKAHREYGEDESKEIIWDFSHRNVFGIEINDRIARIAMMDMVIHDDGHTNIECNDALLPFDAFDPRRDIRPNKYNIVLTNPPFGSREKRTEILLNYQLGKTKVGKVRKSQRKEILYLERCLELVKVGGRIGIVLPDGVLNNTSDKYVREFLLKQAKVIGIVSLPVYAFVPFGSGMRTSLLFLEKCEQGKAPKWGTYEVFMAVANHIGYDSTGRATSLNDLPSILRYFRDRESKPSLHIEFLKPEEFVRNLKVKEIRQSCDFSRLDPDYYFLTRRCDELLSKLSLPLRRLTQLVKDPIKSGARPAGRAQYIEGEIPSLEGGNVSDTGHILAKGLKFIPKSFHESHKSSAVRTRDILVVKDGATTGKVGILPDDFPYEECNINEHLFRVRINEKIVDPYYVFAFLFSELGQLLLRREITGGAQRGIAQSAIRKVLIPIPPEDVQGRIRKSIQDTLERVSELHKDITATIEDFRRGLIDMLQ